MRKEERVKFILEVLNTLYPDPPIPLNHNSHFTLLVAVVLSAQSTDKKVNQITKDLFIHAPNAKAMAKLGEDRILDKIKEIGLSRQKAKYLYELSRIIDLIYQGKVPNSFEELESLPGVGHKTASVVLSQAFGIPTFPVDTHIHRLSQRWGLTNGKNVLQTEKDLKRLFPRSSWNKLHLQIIYYGREYCSAKKCDGTVCRICTTLFPRRSRPFIHIRP